MQIFGIPDVNVDYLINEAAAVTVTELCLIDV